MRPSPFAGPLPDSYWVEDGKLLAGPLPCGADKAAQRANMRALLDAGVRTVIDLRTPMESPGIRVLFGKQATDLEEVCWIGIPILNGAAPTIGELVTILDTIDAAIARRRPVYVHCQGGLGRTGTVAAAWWIRHGRFDLEGALAELAARRVGQPNAAKMSPETAPQLRLLAAWTVGR